MYAFTRTCKRISRKGERERANEKKKRKKKKIYIYIYIYITNAWHVQRLQTLKERGESEREREAASQVEQELCNEITFAT